MPYRYVIDKERRLVVSTGWDCVTFAEAKSHQDQLLRDPDFSPEFNQIVDARTVTALDLSIDEIRTIVNRRIFSPTSKRAFVADRPFVYGMGRMMTTYLEMSKAVSESLMFHDLPSALKWLGLHELPDTIKPESVRKGNANRPSAQDDKSA